MISWIYKQKKLKSGCGIAVGHLRVFAAVKGGIYAPVDKTILFQFNSTSRGQTSLAGENEYWDFGVYNRVFLSESDAKLWWQWNKYGISNVRLIHKLGRNANSIPYTSSASYQR